MTFHEAASFDDDDDIPEDANREEWRAAQLANIRWNTLKVLRQLSQCGLKEDQYKIMELTSVRAPLMKGKHGETSIPDDDQPIEGSSNLFYYLFEDYSAAVRILNSSKKALEHLVSAARLDGEGDKLLMPAAEPHGARDVQDGRFRSLPPPWSTHRRLTACAHRNGKIRSKRPTLFAVSTR